MTSGAGRAIEGSAADSLIVISKSVSRRGSGRLSGTYLLSGIDIDECSLVVHFDIFDLGAVRMNNFLGTNRGIRPADLVEHRTIKSTGWP